MVQVFGIAAICATVLNMNNCSSINNNTSVPPVAMESYAGSISVPNELYAVVDSRKEAEKIAKKLKIKLKAYSYGVATYTVDRSVSDVIKEGKKKKLPELKIVTVLEAK